MFGELDYRCPKCGIELFHADSCKQLVLTCHQCGASHMVSTTPEEIIIKIRPPKEKKADKLKTN